MKHGLSLIMCCALFSTAHPAQRNTSDSGQPSDRLYAKRSFTPQQPIDPTLLRQLIAYYQHYGTLPFAQVTPHQEEQMKQMKLFALEQADPGRKDKDALFVNTITNVANGFATAVVKDPVGGACQMLASALQLIAKR